MIYLYLFGTCFHFIYVFMIIGNILAVSRLRQRFCIEEDEVQFSFLAQIMAVPEGLRIQYVVTVHKIYVLAGSMQQSSVACNG